MRLVFVENHDSFSWNVIDRLPVSRAQVRIVDGREQARVRSAMSDCDALVIGPGPMDPQRAGLVGLVREAAQAGTPLLGICLGHQAIGLAFGARLVRSEPAHGRRDTATFAGSRFFHAFRAEQVMRYHSLSLVDVTEPLQVTATNPEGVVMAVEHATLPIAGLQFHPDSFATPRGAELISAFFEAIR